MFSTARYHTYLVPLFIGMMPFSVHGQSFEYPKSLLAQTLDLLNMLLPILVAVATLFFIWACVQLIHAQKNEDRTEGRKRALWGVIALFILVSIWGLVALLQQIFLGGGASNNDFGVPDFIDEWEWDDDGGESGGSTGGESGESTGGGEECRPGWNDMSNPCRENPLI